MQVPPMYSALKVNGKKLYELARQGIEVERKARKVTINSIDILSVDIKAHWFETQKNRNVFHTGCLDTVRIVVREDRLERKMRMEDEAAVDEEVPFE